MHKITKGLKKKKKGKKSKHKEEELFKPEELEEYRKEHQAAASEGSAEKNEEWKKFIALTSGVDDILKKTQGDLDRIKSTSFFQRKPTESEIQKSAEKLKREEAKTQEAKREEELNKEEASARLGIVEVSESESEEEDDNIFDTAYIDAIAAGEVKLAYIPESPTEKLDGDDPFDTSIAERAILGPEVRRKGKKLVPIGAAVEVLTGRVQLPTCATKRPTSKRQILKERDLLLGSFDESSNLPTDTASIEAAPRTLLDDDSIPLPNEPINLNAPPPAHITKFASSVTIQENVDTRKDIISEFDIITKDSEDPDDLEFETLAAESLSKSAKVLESLPANTSGPIESVEWNAFGEKESVNVEVDPFDTSFAENILPGKVELKIIEKEILGEDIQFNFQENNTDLLNGVSIQSNIIDEKNRVTGADLNLIKPIHRDLLGGSNTDLSVINQQAGSNLCQGLGTDIFDSSVVDRIKDADIIGLDQKLLGEDLSDDDFDPRAEEIPRERTVSRPDVLNISGVKTVSFDLTSPKQSNFLGTGEGGKIIKPLTPFYVRKSSVPELPLEEELSDPFDTSFASNIAPGKAELKVIETELFDPNIEKQLSLVDNDFDPRDDKKAERDKVVGIIKDITNIKLQEKKVEEKVDLLSIDDNISAKVLTPGSDRTYDTLSYCDPFDTSTIATNILPGKTELKLLETELIQQETKSDLDKAAADLLEDHHDIISHQPLSPSADCVEIAAFDDQEDFDPFDTSIANNIQPGKAELKLLASELI